MAGALKEREIEALRERILEWRASKGGKKRMPEELWEAATRLAKARGVSRVSNELGLSYARLKARIGGAYCDNQRGTGSSGGGFVELVNLAGCGQMHVEVKRADGCQLRIEIGTGPCVGAAQIIRAFLE